ncbi:MAG TPA: SDR family NAD(P)-dependent oxidoreductase [Ktedonobacterales bacterium]|nr:SDR family NAD(P)-dependent oxidoreductase [Ktedonobacterales bacterium]
MDISGKVVLITGASEGIGLATARLFAAHGARLALAARSAQKLEQLAAELPGSLAIPTDMRDEQAIKRMIERTREQYGQVDALINNAGQGMHVRVEQADLAQYRAVFELNVVAVIAAMQAVIPIMREQGGGVIVNISSGTTKMLGVGLAPYSSTKHALNAITLAARQELAPDNIRVGLVYPGITATDFHDHLANAGAWAGPRSGMAMETAENVAEKILEAVRTEEAEVFAESVKARMGGS